MEEKKQEHSFSIQMDSKGDLSHVSLTDEPEGVLITGKLGALVDISLEEEVMLEIKGKQGILRIDLTKEELGRINKEIGK